MPFSPDTAAVDLTRLARPHLAKLKPYTSARDEFSGEASVYLDANENPLGSVSGGEFNRYPDPHQALVKKKLAAWRGVSSDQVFIGNGSDEPIDLLIRAFCEPGRDHVLLTPPTYGMYEVSAQVNNVKTVFSPLTADFQLPVNELVSSFRPGTKITFLCSPNNPTGNVLDRGAIRTVLTHAPGLVVVDEAYIDFSPEGSVLNLLEHFPNLVVLQTFSKAWGMAALRVGIAYAHPAVVELLDRIKPPYNVNAYSQAQALQALERTADMQAGVATLLAQRAWLEHELGAMPGIRKVFPSDANFLLIKVDQPDKVYEALMRQGIIVRNRSRAPLCEGCLRVTVGTAEENQALTTALAAILP